MVRWCRRYRWWILSGVAGSVLVALVDIWVQEWIEAGRNDRAAVESGLRVWSPRCLP